MFIPLTRLCRDVCHYCTFAAPPRPGQAAYLTPDEVLAIARAGVATGCREALFTLGDKPELRWDQARSELTALGHDSTLAYLGAMARLVAESTGLLPHLNPGLMTGADFMALRPHAASMGIMLEGSARHLAARGGPHFGSPDKAPAVRLACIEAAGEAAVPFTSGILIGLGETRAERIAALLDLRALHDRYGHLQEIIVQNFQPKPGTRMAGCSAPSLDDHLWTIAVARLLFGPAMSIQAPPNLAAGGLDRYIAAGVNDWGGVSPVTPDHVNPEAPWPNIAVLQDATSCGGKTLVQRLTLYPAYARDLRRWAAPSMHRSILRASDADGLAREDDWCPGAAVPPPADALRAPSPQSGLGAILARARRGASLDESDIVALFAARGPAFAEVCEAADALRARTCGETVSYVVTRNINYTNVCTYACRFCAFSKGDTHQDLRGMPYDLNRAEFMRRVRRGVGEGGHRDLPAGRHPPRL